MRDSFARTGSRHADPGASPSPRSRRYTEQERQELDSFIDGLLKEDDSDSSGWSRSPAGSPSRGDREGTAVIPKLDLSPRSAALASARERGNSMGVVTCRGPGGGSFGEGSMSGSQTVRGVGADGREVLKFKLKVEGAKDGAKKLISLPTQPGGKGMYSDLSRRVTARCDGASYLSFIDADEDLIEIEDDDSLQQFILLLEERQRAGRKPLIMNCSHFGRPVTDDGHYSPRRDLEASSCVPDTARMSPSHAGPCSPRSKQASRIDQIKILSEHDGPVYGCALDRTARLMVSGSGDGGLITWDLADPSDPRVVKKIKHDDDQSGSVLACDLSRDGMMILSSWSVDKNIRIWKTETGMRLQVLRGHGDKIYTACFSPCSKYVLSGSCDRTVKVWSVEKGAKLSTLRGHRCGIYATGWSENSEEVCSAGDDTHIRLWRWRLGEGSREVAPRITLQGHRACVWSCRYTAAGDRLVSASKEGEVILWDTADGQKVWVKEKAHSQGIHRAIFLRGGSQILTASRSGAMKLWDTQTTEEVGKFPKAHRGAIYSASYAGNIWSRHRTTPTSPYGRCTTCSGEPSARAAPPPFRRQR